MISTVYLFTIQMFNSAERIIPRVIIEENVPSNDVDTCEESSSSAEPIQTIINDMAILNELEDIQTPKSSTQRTTKLSELFHTSPQSSISTYAKSTLMDASSSSSYEDEIVYTPPVQDTEDNLSIPTPDLKDINSLPPRVARTCPQSKYICDESNVGNVSIDMSLERQRTFDQFLDSEFNRVYSSFKISAFKKYYMGVFDSSLVTVYTTSNVDSLDTDLTTECMVEAHLSNINTHPNDKSHSTELKYNKYYVVVIDIDSASMVSDGTLITLVLNLIRNLFVYIGHNLILTFNVIPSDQSHVIHDSLVNLVHEIRKLQSKIEYIPPDSEHIIEDHVQTHISSSSRVDAALRLVINHNFVKEMTYSTEQMTVLQEYVNNMNLDIHVDRIFTYNFLHLNFDIIRDKQFRRYAKILSFESSINRRTKEPLKNVYTSPYDHGPYSDFLHHRKHPHLQKYLDSLSDNYSDDEVEYTVTRDHVPISFENISSQTRNQPVISHFHSAKGCLEY